MIATLPMYDFPEVRRATDALWAHIAATLGTTIGLTRNGSYTAAWRNPELLFSQTCGYPYTHEFRGKLTYVATPHYAVPGCVGASYSSIVLAREVKPLAAFKGARAAFNNPDSMSGMLALQLVFGPLASDGNFFASYLESGSHGDSMIAVRDGLADVCATDAVTVALARRYRPDFLEGLVEVGRSPLVPALPYVTIAGDVEALRRALMAALADPQLAEPREQLFLAGASVLPPDAYDRILELEQAMKSAGRLNIHR